MEGGSTKSWKGMPSNGTGLVPIKDPMRAVPTLKVTPLTVVCNVRPPSSHRNPGPVWGRQYRSSGTSNPNGSPGVTDR
jgi:hypothetical protein